MRTLILAAFVSALRVSALAEPCGNDATPEQLAKAVKEALQQKAPLAEGRLVVPTAEVAQAIHRAVTGAVFGHEEIERQRPFKAVRSGDFWVVYGCMPTDPNLLGGVAVTVIRAQNGEVISISHGQ